jgi:hypothetical protein
MRKLRVLGQHVWYEVRSRINNREPLFRRGSALAIFTRVFHETGLRFRFAVCGLSLEDDWLRFYIKPVEGLELPGIMQWPINFLKKLRLILTVLNVDDKIIQKALE